MIQKLELQSVINKYYLNGIVEAVKWEIKDNNLNIKFTSPSKEMIGEINYNDFNVIDSTFGINNTTSLLKLINITSNNLQLDLIKKNHIANKLMIADNQYTVNYALADIQTIPKTGKYNGPNEFHIEATLDQEICDALIKAKSSLPESTVVVFKNVVSLDGDKQLELVFGGDIEFANKVSFFLSKFSKFENDDEFEIHFNSDLIKEILNSNKKFDIAKIFINLNGLVKFEFETEKIKSTYYLVAKEK